jgi:hypothetical protein
MLRTFTRAMGAGNMRRALARITMEWDNILQVAPPEADEHRIDEMRTQLFDLAGNTAFLWGTRNPLRRAVNKLEPRAPS